MGRETELKLALPKASVAALRRHPVFNGSPATGRAATLDNTYYDTPGLALKKAGVALRTRRSGRRWLQTVKAASVSTGGLSSRPEWEQPWSDHFDFSGVDDPSVRKTLERHADALTPLFNTRFRRETRRYAPDDDVEILMMLDTGEIAAGDQREALCELELELVRGEALDLIQLAARLAEDLPLLPDDRSKAERGFRLHIGTPLQPARAEPSSITAEMNPLEAFRCLAFSCLRQWQANAAAGLSHDGAEFIHQLRVSQRRLRSLLRLFHAALPDDFVAAWSSRLQANAANFGDARDFDVLEDELLAPVAPTTDLEAARDARLRARVSQMRVEARASACKALDAAEQGRLLLSFMEALLCLHGNDLIGSVNLPTFAALQLERIRKRVRKRHRLAMDRVPAHLHALRIAFKQLRYGVEFFQPLLPPKATRRYASELARTQTALGYIHDVDIARERLAALAGEDSELIAAAAFVCGWHGPQYSALTSRSLTDSAPLLCADDTPWAQLRKIGSP